MLLALPLGLVVGLVVGAVGGGGAILALPVFVYVLGQSVGAASTASLVVVALAATVAGMAMAREGQVCWRVALGFAAAASLGTLLGAAGNSAVSGPLLLLAFVPVMLLAARAMWRRPAGGGGSGAEDGRARACPHARVVKLAGAGFGVGVLTGFFGVGGGFVIVPVLTLWFGMGVRRAVASSLVIIALTAVAGFGSHLLAGATLDAGVTAALSLAAVAGALGGAAVGARLPSAALGRAFASVVVVVALLLLVDVVALGGPPGG